MKKSKLHIHFNTRSASNPVFHMPPDLIRAALARRRDLGGKIRTTMGTDLDNAPQALKTASMLVTSMQVPRASLRANAPHLRSHPFHWRRHRVPAAVRLAAEGHRDHQQSRHPPAKGGRVHPDVHHDAQQPYP